MVYNNNSTKFSSLILSRWGEHIPYSEIKIILSLLSEKSKDDKIDEKIISSIDNLLFSIKMTYGEEIRAIVKNRKNALVDLDEAVDKERNEILSKKENIFNIIKEKISGVKNKSISSSDLNFYSRRPLFDSNHTDEEIALEIINQNKIVKKTWFGLRINKKITEEKIKKIVNDRFNYKLSGLNLLKNTIKNLQKDK